MQPLAASYEQCRRLHRQYGRSYYLATRLLPARKRRHVHALYALARYADEIVDCTDALSVAERVGQLAALRSQLLAGAQGRAADAGPGSDALLPAVLHTIRVFGIEPEDLAAFLDSMAMDLTVTGYRDYPALLRYMEGSAAVIGTMVLPILGSPDPAAAREPARQLGLAFQLTNFVRDVAEDLARGRVYLPVEDLQRFGVTRADLAAAAAVGAATAGIRALIGYQVQRARTHYALAAPGIALLAPSSRACVGAAYRVYRAILDEIERAEHDVFVRRAVVPTRRRLALAAAALWSPSPR